AAGHVWRRLPAVGQASSPSAQFPSGDRGGDATVIAFTRPRRDRRRGGRHAHTRPQAPGADSLLRVTSIPTPPLGARVRAAGVGAPVGGRTRRAGPRGPWSSSALAWLLLHGPAVAVRVAEEDERVPCLAAALHHVAVLEVHDRADIHAAPDQLCPR